MRVGDAVSDGRLADAARIFSELLANDDELATLVESGYLDEAGRYMPVLLNELEETQSCGLNATDPSLLATIRVPTLLMHGARSALPFVRDGVDHLADHLGDARVREVPAPATSVWPSNPKPSPKR